MSASLLIGAPVWDRAWTLDAYFDSIEANVNVEDTGLAFVVPPTDYASRDVIARRSEPFAYCEVLRDRNAQHDRQTRHRDGHRSLALARNALLRVAQQTKPDHYLSWDSDLFLEPAVVPFLRSESKPICTVWTWLNRSRPRRVRHYRDPEVPAWIDVECQTPMCATAMEWDEGVEQRAHHLDPARWDNYAQGWRRVDCVLALKLMSPQVYGSTFYAPHVYGEDISFNWQLHQRGIERWCYGGSLGVHLALDKQEALSEIQLGYPGVMQLARQRPLAADYDQRRPDDLIALGYFPTELQETA